MTQLINWDKDGERLYEYGVDRGVLFPKVGSAYPKAIPWNGLTKVGENPSGGEAEALYADNIKYLTMIGTEEYGITIEAFTYPEEFEACDGSLEVADGVFIGQQSRSQFGFSYRTKLGSDVSEESGYKLHLVYGCNAAPASKDRTTVNESKEAATFSWEVTTTPVAVTGKKPTSMITIDSTKVAPADLAAFEAILYGTTGTPDVEGRLPLPDEVITLLTAG